MAILILGLLVWAGAHWFKRVAPARRAALGDKKAAIFVALSSVIGIILMVIGYKATDFIPVWQLPEFTRHIAHLLVLIGLFMMTPAPKRGVILSKMRHPMLTGFSLWAIAHLLVNGDLASIVLFGGLLIWASASRSMINRLEPDWAGRAKGKIAMDAMFAVATLIVFGAIAFLHGVVGPSVF